MDHTTSLSDNSKNVLLRNSLIIVVTILAMVLTGGAIWFLSQNNTMMIALHYMLIAAGIVCIAFFAGIIAILIRYKHQREK